MALNDKTTLFSCAKAVRTSSAWGKKENKEIMHAKIISRKCKIPVGSHSKINIYKVFFCALSRIWSAGKLSYYICIYK